MKFNVSLKSRVNQKNFGLTEVGDHVCELNDSDGVKNPDDLVNYTSLVASRLQYTANVVVYSVGIVPGKTDDLG